jgi:hypothetical protein
MDNSHIHSHPEILGERFQNVRTSFVLLGCSFSEPGGQPMLAPGESANPG